MSLGFKIHKGVKSTYIIVKVIAHKQTVFYDLAISKKWKKSYHLVNHECRF